jgi:hypothetical protein
MISVKKKQRRKTACKYHKLKLGKILEYEENGLAEMQKSFGRN